MRNPTSNTFILWRATLIIYYLSPPLLTLLPRNKNRFNPFMAEAGFYMITASVMKGLSKNIKKQYFYFCITIKLMLIHDGDHYCHLIESPGLNEMKLSHFDLWCEGFTMLISLREKCSYLELFWSAFYRIRTE